MLASAHSNQILIWDRRVCPLPFRWSITYSLSSQKGSLPVSRINAHNSKIYGIDWSHSLRNEIVTCSLDKTIKVWDIHVSTTPQEMHEPKTTIRTTYPVWRARNLPFGQGVLSLAQRGETALEMYAHDDSQTPVETFEGHTDVVKEFVWRNGGQGGWMVVMYRRIFLISVTRPYRISAHHLVKGQNPSILACGFRNNACAHFNVHPDTLATA